MGLRPRRRSAWLNPAEIVGKTWQLLPLGHRREFIDLDIRIEIHKVRGTDVIDASLLHPGVQVETEYTTLANRLRHANAEHEWLAMPAFGSLVKHSAHGNQHFGEQGSVLRSL